MILSCFGGNKIELELVHGEPLSLCCWSCGKKHAVLYKGNEELKRFNVWSRMREAGMIGKADFSRKMVLIFCSEECAESSLNSSGNYRYKKVG